MKQPSWFTIVMLALLQGCVIVPAPSAEELALLDNPPADVRKKRDSLAPLAVQWMNAAEAELASSGRPLTADELTMAEALGVQYPDRIRVLVLDDFPLPKNESLEKQAKEYGLGSYAEGGRTMGYVILVKPRFAHTQWLLAHEMVHVAQMETMGRDAFMRRLITEYEMMGHSRSPLELQANKRALEYM